MKNNILKNLRTATVMVAVIAAAVPTFGVPSGGSEPAPLDKDPRVLLQGDIVVALHIIAPKCRMEIESFEISRKIFELARKYPSASSLNLKIKIDASQAPDESPLKGKGIVDLDEVNVSDLSHVRNCSSYQTLLYGDFFWLPSRLQISLERLIKGVETK